MGIFPILIDDLQARLPLAYHIAPIEDLDHRVKMCRGALDAIPTGMQRDNFLGASPVMYLKETFWTSCTKSYIRATQKH